MSLKIFHSIFIFLSLLLSAFTSFWFFTHNHLLLSLLSFSSFLSLLVYFGKVLRRFFFALLSVLILPIHFLDACAVCFGNAQSSSTKALSFAVLTMLLFVVFFWIVFAVFFFSLYKSSQSHNEVS